MHTTTEQLFTDARSHNGWRDRPVPESTLRQLWDLLKWGPTSANCSPLRIAFVSSPEGKAKLVPLMSAGNRDKTAQAPVTALLGMDLGFVGTLPQLFPHVDARPWFEGDEMVKSTAFRNSSLQGGYFIVAARALGLDCGPMSGFDAAAVDAAFWAGTQVRTNFVCSIGHGDPARLFARSPRLTFEQACRIL